MKIDALHFYHLKIPFKVTFKHSSASRDTTESIWVEAVGNNNVTGIGESCPRSYVTGETLQTVMRFLNSIKDRLINEVNSIESLKEWVTSEENNINKNPAAWCAVELALLDLFAKTTDTSVEKALGLPAVEDTFNYSAVLGDSDINSYKAQLDKYLALQFTDFKIKVSGDPAKDKAKLAFFDTPDRRSYRVRLDANNLWRNPSEVINYVRALNSPVWALEEPLKPGDFKGMTCIAKELKLRIILDESILNIDQLYQLEKSHELWIINLRISKMGGIIRSKNIADAVKAAGIGIIIGAQVGETSMLTRAALTIAQYINKDIIAQEGAFGTYLLADDIVDSPLMFNKAGTLNVEKFSFNTGAGFGLPVKSIEEYLTLL